MSKATEGGSEDHHDHHHILENGEMKNEKFSRLLKRSDTMENWKKSRKSQETDKERMKSTMRPFNSKEEILEEADEEEEDEET
eukprot:g38215.t1